MYQSMAEILKPAKAGDYEISLFEIKKGDFSAAMSGIPYGNYARLLHRGECVMSDTPMEMRTNIDFVRSAFGDVLIGGLGIGLILLAIQNEKSVHTITVIEKSKEVIELVKPQLPLNGKVSIINDDVFNFAPSKGTKYDMIYMDIWDYVNSDVYENEMKPLKARYRRYLKPKSVSPNRKVFCWAEWQAKNDRRLY